MATRLRYAVSVGWLVPYFEEDGGKMYYMYGDEKDPPPIIVMGA